MLSAGILITNQCGLLLVQSVAKVCMLLVPDACWICVICIACQHNATRHCGKGHYSFHWGMVNFAPLQNGNLPLVNNKNNTNHYVHVFNNPCVHVRVKCIRLTLYLFKSCFAPFWIFALVNLYVAGAYVMMQTMWISAMIRDDRVSQYSILVSCPPERQLLSVDVPFSQKQIVHDFE